jgi:hypothetical protein
VCAVAWVAVIGPRAIGLTALCCRPKTWKILRTVSGYIAVAIENALLYQEQQHRAA